MASLIEPGAIIDGFTIGECVHHGGMATLWSVTHPDIAMPLLMKIPRLAEGEDPAAIVSFEMEMMILPRLKGVHVPACFGTGDFARQAYAVIECIPGETLYRRLPALPLPCDEARLLGGKIAFGNAVRLSLVADIVLHETVFHGQPVVLGLHHVADGNHAGQAAVANHRQVTNAACSHQAHDQF